MKLSKKNQATYRLWQRAKATNFAYMPARLLQDPITAKNFAELDAMEKRIAEQKQIELLSLLIAGRPSE